MKKRSDAQAVIFLLLRLFICLWLGWKALNVWGIGGRITDMYTDEEVLRLPRESFWCNKGLWLAMGLAGALFLWDTVKICRYEIVTYLLEKPCRLRFGPLAAAVWLTLLAVGAGLTFQGWRILAPYEKAMDDYLAGGEGREESAVPYPLQPIFRKLPDEPVTSIQINTIKDYPPAGTEGFQAFLDGLGGLETLDPTLWEATKRGEDYLVVTLRYENGSHANLFFFQPEEGGEAWYVEASDGVVFTGGEFITDYVNMTQAEAEPSDGGTGGELIFDEERLRQSVELNRRLEGLGVSPNTEDLRGLFAMEMLDQLPLWDTEEEALQAAEEELAQRLQRYSYAVQMGYGLTEEELDARIAERDAMIKSAPNFSELEAAYEAAGTTWEEYGRAQREADRIAFTEERLYQAAYEEFRHGNDRIGNYECGDVEEYWRRYLQDVVYPETKDWRESTLMPLLEEAEGFWQSQQWEMPEEAEPSFDTPDKETEPSSDTPDSEALQRKVSGGDVRESVQCRLTDTQERSDALERDIQENASRSQADLNVKSQELYELWDSMLNEVWEALAQTQEAEAMERLTTEEREWIAWKEQQVREAGAEFEGGSLQPMVCAQKAAKLTRERVYELISVLDP